MREHLLYGLVFITALLSTSCSSSVEIGYFSLPRQQVDAEKSYALEESVAVENFTSPSPLQRQEILMRCQESPQIFISSQNMWWSLPSEMVSESFKNYLTEHKVFRRVFSYPSTHRVRFVIEGVLHRFEIRTFENQWQACVALQLYMIDDAEKVLWESGTLTAMKSCNPNYRKAALAMGLALNELWVKIEKQLRNELAELSASN